MRAAATVPPGRRPDSKRTAKLAPALVLASPLLLLLGGEALAQKFPGPATPPPAARPARPTPFDGPAFPQGTAPGTAQGAPQGANPAVEQQAMALPLDPATRELRDAVPADVPGVERQLGLREPRGPRTDLRGRTPSPQEIADALAPR